MYTPLKNAYQSSWILIIGIDFTGETQEDFFPGLRH